MKEVKLIQTYRDLSKFSILATGDWHIGNRYHNQKRLEEDLEWVKNHQTSDILLMGDLLECKTPKSPGGVANQVMTIQDQKEKVLDYLRPLKGRIIGLLAGNHEMRAWKELGVDIAGDMCRELGIPYLGFAGFIDIRVQKYHYTIYATHGSGGSRYKHSRLSWIMKWAIDNEADLYICGHFHDSLSASDRIQVVDKRNKTIKLKERYFAINGSYVNYGGYVERQQFPPGKIGSTKIILSGEKWDLRIQN